MRADQVRLLYLLAILKQQASKEQNSIGSVELIHIFHPKLDVHMHHWILLYLFA
jgi:hypothetical protein